MPLHSFVRRVNEAADPQRDKDCDAGPYNGCVDGNKTTYSIWLGIILVGLFIAVPILICLCLDQFNPKEESASDGATVVSEEEDREGDQERTGCQDENSNLSDESATLSQNDPPGRLVQGEGKVQKSQELAPFEAPTPEY